MPVNSLPFSPYFMRFFWLFCQSAFGFLTRGVCLLLNNSFGQQTSLLDISKCALLAFAYWFNINNKHQTFSDGCLGSCNDEGRSELRYAVWIAEFSESSDCWTWKALLRFFLDSTSVSVFLNPSKGRIASFLRNSLSSATVVRCCWPKSECMHMVLARCFSLSLQYRTSQKGVCVEVLLTSAPGCACSVFMRRKRQWKQHQKAYIYIRVCGFLPFPTFIYLYVYVWM